ncbi:hypothetical protein [Fodinibius sp.]|uniref:hypothetical protein n=1 Tax=Fodinibius sp. TaxID=1872440 RepID=UPI002ACE76D1|nr:hypothetical protein [Fodinibius sp.]MDZ7659859.1 hypothetical protein [Fodinibius sp.]
MNSTNIFILIFASIFLFGTSVVYAQTDTLSKEDQIKAAVSPAPDGMKKGARVLGYNDDGELTTLRDGSNQLICIADDPDQDNFHVACYHEDLEPFMKRGRELKAKGLSREKVDSIRYKEIEEGKIALPRKPMALYSITGSAKSFDYTTGMVKNASPLYVIYIPYATEESTGLSKKPASKGAPWIMEPGTPWAHIMVMTGRDI